MVRADVRLIRTHDQDVLGQRRVHLLAVRWPRTYTMYIKKLDRRSPQIAGKAPERCMVSDIN